MARVTPAAAVLIYHRVAAVNSDPQLLSVTPEHFAEHLEVLCRMSSAISLRDLAQALDRRNAPKGAVAITLDDGYADNLHHARAILSRYDVPATVFATSGNVLNGENFWWDQLDRLLLRPGSLPQHLEAYVGGAAYQWDLGSGSTYTEGDYLHHRRWSVLQQDNPTSRHAVYRQLHRLVRPMCPAARDEVMEQVLAWASVEKLPDADCRPLRPEELAALRLPGLVEVGSHTVSHPVLAALPPEAQQDEVQQSKRNIEEIIGQPVSSFSYPFGSRKDYTSKTVRMVNDAGYIVGCANFPGLVHGHAHKHQLPRFLVRDWDGDQFARHLKAWFQGRNAP